MSSFNMDRHGRVKKLSSALPILARIFSHLDDVSMTTPARSADPSAWDSPPRHVRQHWLAVLAHAPRELLERHAGAISGAAFVRLRAPEVGLTMIRARIGNRGDRFNLGDATVTRCVVRHLGLDGRLAAGLGYVLGRDEARAEWVARLDAMLQQPEHHEALMRDIIVPLAVETAHRRAQAAARTATSRVDFETLATETSR
jgi:alpha-D-ribose 1-methylphosphonate 5-triphosphate synthase subunit PhnG